MLPRDIASMLEGVASLGSIASQDSVASQDFVASQSQLSIIASLQRIQVIKYLIVSTTALLAYDYALTIYPELRLVWKAPWRMGKILFLLTRYFAFAGTALKLYEQLSPGLTAEKCRTLFNVEGWMVIISIVIAELILTIRVWALWGRTRRTAMFLTTVAVIVVVVSAVGFVKFHGEQSYITIGDLSPTLGGCFPVYGNDTVWIDFLMLVVYESVREGTSSFFRIFFRDGVSYYFFTLSISVANVIVLFAASPDYANLLTSMQRGLHSILSARMLLNIREDYERAARVTLEPLDFGEAPDTFASDATPGLSAGGVSSTLSGGTSTAMGTTSITLGSNATAGTSITLGRRSITLGRRSITLGRTSANLGKTSTTALPHASEDAMEMKSLHPRDDLREREESLSLGDEDRGARVEEPLVSDEIFARFEDARVGTALVDRHRNLDPSYAWFGEEFHLHGRVELPSTGRRRGDAVG
ncbi:hypothetical protein BD626DRAFT_540395 [Schizophyllum amplum]|uniref:DUF6533 domain-containing protein n=1 Tax=Schizophyllum amplum TaxID=97359 RepID=A0A550BYI4_9AGAR|nr:hypothetical protein BD626DRAFT_540395 [Auriculariopsis ampla]